MTCIRFGLPGLVVATLIISGCAAGASTEHAALSSTLMHQRLAALSTECRTLAATEERAHGTDEMAGLPAVCASLGSAIQARAAGSRDSRLANEFGQAYESCVAIGKHRGALFSYRGHPGATMTYRRVRTVCDAYARSFEEAAVPARAAANFHR